MMMIQGARNEMRGGCPNKGGNRWELAAKRAVVDLESVGTVALFRPRSVMIGICISRFSYKRIHALFGQKKLNCPLTSVEQSARNKHLELAS